MEAAAVALPALSAAPLAPQPAPRHQPPSRPDNTSDSDFTFGDDGPRPGDKENPFRGSSLSNNGELPPASTRLARSHGVIEDLQRNLLASTTTRAPLAQHEDTSLPGSPLLRVKSREEKEQQQQSAAAFDVTDLQHQSNEKLAFLRGQPQSQSNKKKGTKATTTPVVAVNGRNNKVAVAPSDKSARSAWSETRKPPVPAKKDALRSLIQAKPLGLPKVNSVRRKTAAATPIKQQHQHEPNKRRDVFADLLKNLVSDTATAWGERRSERTRGGGTSSGEDTQGDATTAPSGPQPAPRSRGSNNLLVETTFLSGPSPATESPPPPFGHIRQHRTPPTSPTQSLSPSSPNRTPPERSHLLEQRLNEIRRDLWSSGDDPREPRSITPDPRVAAAATAVGRRRYDSLPTSPVTERPGLESGPGLEASEQEAALRLYASAIQRHLDGLVPQPLHDISSSSAHSSTSTLVSTPVTSPPQSPGSLPEHRGRRLTESDSPSPVPEHNKRRLRDELIGFYYRSLEREAHRHSTHRSGRSSAPPTPYHPVGEAEYRLIPVRSATYTPDRTLRQEFPVALGRPPPSPAPSDTALYSNLPPTRQAAGGSMFVRGSPQRNTVGTSQPSRRVLHRDEVDLHREFGGEVQLRHPEKLIKKRNNSESSSGSGKNKKGSKSSTSPGSGKKSSFLIPPIFRKGSLHPEPASPASDSAGTPPPTLPKRVSFSSPSSPLYVNGGSNKSSPVSRPESSDSVFLPNPPQGYTERIYANERTSSPRTSDYGPPPGRLALGDETYVNYSRPTPPESTPRAFQNGVAASVAISRPSPPRQVTVVAGGRSPGTPPHMSQHRGGPAAPFIPVVLNANGLYGRAPGVTRDGTPGGTPPRASSATPTMMAAPDRPLPPIPIPIPMGLSESESGSEAGEVQRILSSRSPGERSRVHDSSRSSSSRDVGFGKRSEEEWGIGGKGHGAGDLAGPPGGGVRGDEEMRRGGGRGPRRDDPRRHTLGGDQHTQPPQGGSLSRSMDLEMNSQQRRKSPMARGYPPPSNAMLFDEDPGIMSEVETSSTGFHRGGKQRSSLPVVRTPSKTLERPLGLVFLQYRSETKRALLPNEITSLDTVKALFVRSFSKQLTMQYLDSPLVKIYIHDSNKDMFYELEDHRSHLRDIRDRSVLRLFESSDVHSGVFPGAGTGLVAPPLWEQDQSYFSEPEFDSEFQHQHIHKSKASKGNSVPPQPYYMTHSYPPGPPGAAGAGPGSSATLPRGGSMMRAYSPAPKSALSPPSAPIRSYMPPTSPLPLSPRPPPPRPPLRNRKYFPPYFSPSDPSQPSRGATAGLAILSPDRLHAESGYMSSPERGGSRTYPAPYSSSTAVPYEEGYYGQYGTRSGSITPVIDEEASDTELMEDQYSLYGVKPGGLGPLGPRTAAARAPFPAPAGPPYDTTRIRVENMERQLANLTGLVQKALTHGPTHLAVPAAQTYRNDDPTYVRSDVKPPKLGKDKSVSFEKSVSFSDEPPDMNSPKQHSPQHGADTKPTKPAIKSSTLPRTSSQERDRNKPAPPPKPMSLSPGQYEGRNIYRDLQLTPEMYNQLRCLQKKAKDLRQEVRNLRRMSQAQAHSVRETIRDTFIKIRAMLITGAEGSWAAIGDSEKLRLSREEELYKQEMLRLEKDLTELESTVEELRGNVINRKTRVNMSDVENMALVLSKSSKTVADLKVRFPGLQDEMKNLLSAEMEKVMREEKFLKEEPERLESALRRCKKLTGTLVTLKRLASVQEQRLPGPGGSVTADPRLSPTLDDEPLPPTPNSASSKAGGYSPGRGGVAATDSGGESKRPENALDALLDELQTFAKPPASNNHQSHAPNMAEIGRRKGSIETPNPPGSSPAPAPTPNNPTSSLRRLHSYPSSSDGGGNSPPTIARLQVSDSKPPVPERNADLLAKRVPPPPPPRTSSRSPLASPTSPSLPPRGQNPPCQPQMGTQAQGTLRRGQASRSSVRSSSIPGADTQRNPLPPADPSPTAATSAASAGCEAADKKGRQEALEQRHQELLRKQRALQEQYARLQQLQRGTASVPTPDLLLKKTGSESNLLAKMGMQGLSAAAPMSGSLTHLAVAASSAPLTPAQTTTSKIYETDIL